MCLLPLAGPLLSGGFGVGRLLPGSAGEGGNEGEDTAKIIPGQLQQTPPPQSHFLVPLMLNLKLELVSGEKRGQSL